MAPIRAAAVRSTVPAWVLAATMAAACSSPDGGSAVDAPEAPFDRGGLLRRIAVDLLTPGYAQFATDATALDAAVDAHCAVLDASGDGAATETAARAAWRTAIATWQRLDAVMVGPGAADDLRLRNRIYAWPLLAPCTIDQDVVARWSAPGSFDVATRLDNVRSLAAVEYLLHPTSAVSSCPLSPSGWDALGADLPRARCGLAAAITADVATQAAALAEAWRPGGGDYGTTLATAGQGGSSIPTEREGLNMISDALFYLDKMVKDMKLGESAGIVINACGTVEEPCLREVEHRFADASTLSVRANLAGLRAAFTGTIDGADGLGFDDYLIAVGATDLATRMVGNLDLAITRADALPESFLTALASDRASVVALHATTKAITDDLKAQFLTVLGLEIPDDVAGDND